MQIKEKAQPVILELYFPHIIKKFYALLIGYPQYNKKTKTYLARFSNDIFNLNIVGKIWWPNTVTWLVTSCTIKDFDKKILFNIIQNGYYVEEVPYQNKKMITQTMYNVDFKNDVVIEEKNETENETYDEPEQSAASQQEIPQTTLQSNNVNDMSEERKKRYAQNRFNELMLRANNTEISLMDINTRPRFKVRQIK